MPSKSLPMNAEPPLQSELKLSLAIETAGALIRRYPEAERVELFQRALRALLRASDAPCMVSVLHVTDTVERDALADVAAEGHA